MTEQDIAGRKTVILLDARYREYFAPQQNNHYVKVLWAQMLQSSQIYDVGHVNINFHISYNCVHCCATFTPTCRLHHGVVLDTVF